MICYEVSGALNGRSPGPEAGRVQEEPRPAADDRDVAQGDGGEPEKQERVLRLDETRAEGYNFKK